MRLVYNLDMKKYVSILLCAVLLAGCQKNASESPSIDTTQGIELVPAQSDERDVSPDSGKEEESAVASETEDRNRTVYQPGFFYEPLSDEIKERITGISYQENPTISYQQLRYVQVLYFDFDEKECTGELICNEAIAQDLVEILYELHQASYPIEKIRLIDEYNGDDEASMSDNNSSCFNYRVIAGTTKLSKHALGLAVDINPLYNPYVTNFDGDLNVAPANAGAYADRSAPSIAKITHNDLAYQLFTEHGFTWGGDWKNSKDYQHFQKED